MSAINNIAINITERSNKPSNQLAKFQFQVTLEASFICLNIGRYQNDIRHLSVYLLQMFSWQVMDSILYQNCLKSAKK